ncbi:hypothetical protein [Trichormus azollae]|nr:hypothetical protein [Trichormus azollae]
MVARSLKLASRKFTSESRPSQVAEVVNFYREDSILYTKKLPVI